MSRIKKIIRNIIIVGILVSLFFIRSGLYLSPLSAHKHSERSIHYGPSEVIHVEDFSKGKYILGKYDRWVSCNTVNRVLFFFWRFGNSPIGFKNDESKAIAFTWGSSNQYYKLYGIVNDPKINKIEITFSNDKALTQTDFYDDLFLFTWETNNNKIEHFTSIKGYDSDNNLIFEEGY